MKFKEIIVKILIIGAGIGKVELSEVRYHVFVVFPQWLPVNYVHTLKRNLCFNIFRIFWE